MNINDPKRQIYDNPQLFFSHQPLYKVHIFLNESKGLFLDFYKKKMCRNIRLLCFVKTDVEGGSPIQFLLFQNHLLSLVSNKYVTYLVIFLVIQRLNLQRAKKAGKTSLFSLVCLAHLK